MRWGVFSRLKFPGSSESIAIDKEFAALPAERLRPKVYVFSGERESRSQFAGLRDFGPLQPLPGATKLLFVFRERDRQAARRLAVSLRGLKQQGQFSFPGFKRLFKTDIEIDPQPVVLPDLSEQTMEALLDRAKSERESATQLVPIIVLPEGEDNGYYELKALFSNSSLPTQVCTLKILEDEDFKRGHFATDFLKRYENAPAAPEAIERATAKAS